MRKALISLFIFIFIFSNATAFAQMPVTVAGIVPVGLEKIGVVAATKGKVELTTPGQIGRIASSGQEIFMGDEVKTDAQGHLQVLLLDETIFTIGPASAIIIDEFVYDPKTQDGKMQASVTQGIFRYVSGKIAAKKPSNVTIKLPTATMGIRGTIIAGEVRQDRSALVALLGPGDNNDAGARIGSFVMTGTGENAGEKQEVNRSGFGVQIGANGSVSGALQLSTAEIGSLAAGLLPHVEQKADTEGRSGGDSGGGQPGSQPPAGQPHSDQAMDPARQGGESSPPPPGAEFFGKESVTRMSGEGMAIARDTVKAMNVLSRFIGQMDWQSQQAAQDAAVSQSTTTNSAASRTTLADMNSVSRASGSDIFNFSKSNGVLSGANNTFTFFINIDFPNPGNSASRVAGGNSRVEVDYHGNLLKYSLGLDVWISGENPFQFDGLADSDGTPDPNLKADIAVTIENAAAPTGNSLIDIAAQANVSVQIIDTSNNTSVVVATGSAVSDARNPGATA